MEAYDEGLEKVKNIVCNSQTLMNFDPSKEIAIHTDASMNRLGSCLMQQVKPVAYASRGKEMLGILFVVKRFHN